MRQLPVTSIAWVRPQPGVPGERLIGTDNRGGSWTITHQPGVPPAVKYLCEGRGRISKGFRSVAAAKRGAAHLMTKESQI